MNKNIVVHGKGGIRVEVVLHSKSSVTGKELITFLVNHPRLVHSEELKHRQFSFSAASSRAIPFDKMLKQLSGKPVSFGKNQSGMQAGEDHNELINGMYTPDEWWDLAKLSAINFSRGFADAGYHKQVSGRLSEPFQMIRVLVSATETDNFYWLRDDKAADPTLAEQARCMREAHKLSTPQTLNPGEWHLPFVEYYNEVIGEADDGNSILGPQQFYIGDMLVGEEAQELTLDEAIKVSCARSAATSFRNENYGLEKSLQVYDRLVNGDKVHAGALEHCGTPMAKRVENLGTHMSRKDWVNIPNDPKSWQDGISHMDKDRNLWSGNFQGFIQHRKLVPNECYKALDTRNTTV